MIREAASRAGLGSGDSYRWRADQVTRPEGFSDVVFGFALTLLVVPLEVPRDFGEMMAAHKTLAARRRRALLAGAP